MIHDRANRRRDVCRVDGDLHLLVGLGPFLGQGLQALEARCCGVCRVLDLEARQLTLHLGERLQPSLEQLGVERLGVLIPELLQRVRECSDRIFLALVRVGDLLLLQNQVGGHHCGGVALCGLTHAVNGSGSRLERCNLRRTDHRARRLGCFLRSLSVALQRLCERIHAIELAIAAPGGAEIRRILDAPLVVLCRKIGPVRDCTDITHRLVQILQRLRLRFGTCDLAVC